MTGAVDTEVDRHAHDGHAAHPAIWDGQPPAGYTPAGTYPAGTYPVGYVPAEPGRFARFMIRAYTRAPRWAAPVAVLGCFATASAYVLVADPTHSAAEAPPTCLLKLTTGLDCPGCGGTRAFWYLLHGNLPAAARHHAMFVFAVPFLIYMYVAWAGERVFGRRLPQLRITPTAISVFLAAWAVFSVLRNLPWAPFTWLYV